MNALWERMESAWTLSRLGHGRALGTDEACVDAMMVGTRDRMLCARGGVCVDVIIHGWDRGAQREGIYMFGKGSTLREALSRRGRAEFEA